MRKKERLLEELKRATGPLSAGELAEQVGCSPRQVRRLIEQLQKEGHPIRKVGDGPQTRYELQGIPEVEKAISSIDLSEQQVLLLLLSLYMTMHSLKDTSLYKQLVELIRRVRETMNPELVYWLKDNPELETRLFNQAPAPSFDPAMFFEVMKAVLHGKRIRVTERSPKNTVEEVVEPITLALMSAVPVLLVRDAEGSRKGTIRPIPLAMIESLEVLDEGFVDPGIDPSDLERLLAPDTVHGATVEEPFEVRFRVDSVLFENIRMTNLVRGQRREKKGNTCYLVLPFNSVVHAIGICLETAPYGMIEEPVWMRDAIGYIVHRTAEAYPDPKAPPRLPTGLPVLVPVMNLVDHHYGPAEDTEPGG